MIPIRDTIPSSRFPVVTYALIGVNVLVFFYQLSLEKRLLPFVERYAVIPARLLGGGFPPARELLTPVTAMFLAVVDTANRGAIAWVYRRAAGSHEVLPLPAVLWTAAQVGPRLLRGIEIHDGRQRLSLLYDDDGRIADRSLDARFPGRLVELARVLKNAKDEIGESVAFVTGLGDEQYGPGRAHYPVPVPGGVGAVWTSKSMEGEPIKVTVVNGIQRPSAPLAGAHP